MPVKWDANGIRLADVPNAGVSRVDQNAKSGNPRHDARSGKFGSGGGAKRAAPVQTPAQADPLEYARMIDAARDAARSFEDFTEEDIREFIQGRANSPDQVDIAAFIKIIEEQRKADIVDLLDQNMRLGKRKVRVTASRGYIRKLLGKAGSDGIAEIMSRLEAMGHDRDKIDDFFAGRVDVAEEAKKKRDSVAASQWHANTIPPLVTEDDIGELQEASFDPEKYVAQFAAILEKIPPPTINVEIKMPEAPDA